MIFSRDELKESSGGYVVSRTVRFQDVDAAGIIFFARIFEYFHDAMVEWMDAGGLRLADALRQASWGAPLKHAEADFLRPLRFGDAVDVAVATARLDGSELSVGYRIVHDGEVCAVGTCVHVFIDMKTFRRAPPPPEMTALLATL